MALSCMALIVGAVAYYQLFHDSTRGPDLVANKEGLEETDEVAPTYGGYTIDYEKPAKPKVTKTYTSTARISQTPPKVVQKSVSYQGTPFKQQSGDYPYYVAEKTWNPQTQEYEFYRKGMLGNEVPLKIEARRYFLSENQSDYPEPESGCGPTALLNLYIWYTKFGLIKESIRHSNLEKYKQLKFQQIDRKLLDIQRASRTRNGGTNTLAAIVAMDELVQQYAKSPTRLHFEIKKPPLKRKDFTALSLHYRVGILSVRPKDPRTGRLMGNHAVLCVRGDTAGMVSIANWGKFSHGFLQQRDDGQWFVPQDASQHELRINNLTTLIPFTPAS